ncbi:hypothetical protein B0H12DRAFT_1143545 [Mycena haematopus]|nr:hypothetical protein B0H12DRAFT_1143545 [Mycena haematopus]
MGITVLFRPSIQSRVTGTRELNTFEKCHRSQGSLNTLKCQVFIWAKINFFFKAQEVPRTHSRPAMLASRP